MATLLLRLVGPMQAWGTTSRFNERDSGPEPSKSGVLGLLAAASGLDRSNWLDLEPLTRLAMGVRHDRPGTPGKDFQTAGCAASEVVMRADGTLAVGKDSSILTTRHFLADAAFLVGLESDDQTLLARLQAALLDPKWPLCLGRKAYVPSEPVALPEALRPIQDLPLIEVLRHQPWVGTRRKEERLPRELRLSLEASDGSGVLRFDQPLASFAERHFGARHVQSTWIPFPEEEPHAAV